MAARRRLPPIPPGVDTEAALRQAQEDTWPELERLLQERQRELEATIQRATQQAREDTSQENRAAFILRATQTQEGREALARAMAQPLRGPLDYGAVGRHIFQVDPLLDPASTTHTPHVVDQATRELVAQDAALLRGMDERLALDYLMRSFHVSEDMAQALLDPTSQHSLHIFLATHRERPGVEGYRIPPTLIEHILEED